MAAVLNVKTPADRNKLIAAAVLGVLALAALYLAFGPSLFGSSTTSVKVTASPIPRPPVASANNTSPISMPTASEQAFTYQTTAIDYRPGSANAPDPGRNIFAFYEPPPPCPPSICPPTPKPTPVPTAIPTPVPPPVQATSVNPQMVYAGSPRGFRLEVGGDKFTPDMHIYFNQVQMPTTFVNAQKLVTEIPANMVVNQGVAGIIIQNPDGKLYSNQLGFTIQAPPRPSLTYIGMISRARHNNDTAYFTQQGQPMPFGARLNDVVQGRFRVIDISAAEVVLQDTELGFKSRIQLSRASSGAAGGSPTGLPPSGFPNGFQNFNPTINNPCVPGIPCNLPINPQTKQTPDPNKKDVDDDDDGPPEQ